MSALAILASASVGGIASSERRTFLEAMFSQPLIIAVTLGAVWGNVEQAAFLGFLFQLYYLTNFSAGAALPADEALASTVTITFSLWMARIFPEKVEAVQGLGLLCGVFFGHFGRTLEHRVWRENTSSVIRSGDELKVNHEERLILRLFGGVGKYFITWFIVALLSISVIGEITIWLLPLLPHQIIKGLAFFRNGFFFIAVFIAVRGLRVKHQKKLFLAGVGVGAIALVALMLL